jgi:hypothetical protein
LGSGTANADWGDVYYCQMTSHGEITLEGKQTNYKLGKFQFKLDQTKNAMVFGSGGFFGGSSPLELSEGRTFAGQELWVANGEWDLATFETGKLLYSNTTFAGILSISADCDKF